MYKWTFRVMMFFFSQTLISSNNLDCLKQVIPILEPSDLETAFLDISSLGGNSFMEAVITGNVELLEFLFQLGVDVLGLDKDTFLEEIDFNGDNAFNNAVKDGYLESATFLYSVGVNVQHVSFASTHDITYIYKH